MLMAQMDIPPSDINRHAPFEVDISRPTCHEEVTYRVPDLRRCELRACRVSTRFPSTSGRKERLLPASPSMFGRYR